MSTIEQLTQHEKSGTYELNLSSGNSYKIRHINNLTRFTALRVLNLSNNLITKIENLSSLTHLVIVNLEFNQINTIEGLEYLHHLEELFLSYNNIETIPEIISMNSKLKIIHLAYNDLKEIGDIMSLTQLAHLSILSLFGNPFLALLNYITFLKMILPSLMIIDDRDANECVVSGEVYPQDEVVVLREALGAAIHERNMVGVSQDGKEVNQQGIEGVEVNEEELNDKGQNDSDRDRFVEIMVYWMSKTKEKVETKKLEMGKLTDLYASKMQEGRQFDQPVPNNDLIKLIKKFRRYKEKLSKGELDIKEQEELIELEEELKQSQLNNVDDDVNRYGKVTSKNVLALIKAKEQEYLRVKKTYNQLKKLLQLITENAEEDFNKLILFKILFGVSLPNNSHYRELKSFLVQEESVIEQIRKLKLIIFGEEVDGERVDQLVKFLQEKNLIEIINDLKEMRVAQKKTAKRFDSERKRFLDELERETKLICEERDRFKQEKQEWQAQMMEDKRQADERHSNDKYRKIEEDEKQRISKLKVSKETMEKANAELKAKNDELTGEFERKYKELEEFESYFEDFKREKELITDMKEEMQEIKEELSSKEQLLEEVGQRLKELSLREEISSEKLKLVERRSFEKIEELKDAEERLKSVSERLRKITEELNVKSYELMKIVETISEHKEEQSDCEKKFERARYNLQTYEEKLRNLSEIELAKKNSIRTLELQILEEKKEFQYLNSRNIELEKKVNRGAERAYEYQLKLQENKNSLESLTDLNKAINDMMERQSQLKRNIIELEIENDQLISIKDSLQAEIKATSETVKAHEIEKGR